MADSVVAICNRALDLLGAKPIMSLDDPISAAALLNRQYPIARNAVLRSYPWNCAMALASLAADATAPAWGYASRFQLPEDCLRVVEVDGYPDSGVSWRIVGRYIMTDETGALNIRYVSRMDDPAQMDELLADAIAVRLAADIAFSITATQSAQQAMVQLYELRIKEARRIDSLEQSQDDVVVADTWLNSRLSAPFPG